MQHRGFTSFLAGLVAMTATTHAPAQTQTITVVNPSHFKVGKHHYDFSVGGLREYVDSLKKNEPELHMRLDKKLSELESSRNTGIGIMAGGLGGGLLLSVAAIATSGNDGNSDPSLPPAMIVGLGLMAISPIGLLVMPGRSDYLRFINQHNDMDPPSPINLQLGLAPAPGGGQGWLTATF